MLNPGVELQNRYKIERQIGAGGMGTVYIATDLRFNAKVAIKETFFADADMRRAFENEAQLLNGLRHPALPRVSDHFCEGDGQFIVMEYIAGKDLSELIKSRFSVTDVLRWADALLDALDYLHSQKTPILHRDIKPQNLKLTDRGEVILLDFGLAKGSVSEQTRAATAQSVYGYSLSYAPLEQIQGIGTDARTDLYSLAATIYHLLTGQPPVDCIARATAIVKGCADPLEYAHKLNDKISVSISEVLNKAMTLNPNLRPTSAAKMRRELTEAASQTAQSENLGVAAANEKTIAIDYGSLKSNPVGAATKDLAMSSKIKLTKFQTVNGRQTGIEKSSYQTDYLTRIGSSAKSNGSQTVYRRATPVRESSYENIFSHLQNSRSLQLGALLTFLLLGCGVGAAWYSVSPSNVAPMQNLSLVNAANTSASSMQTGMSNTETNTGNNAPSYSVTPYVFRQETATVTEAGTTSPQSLQTVAPQPQTSADPQEITQIASVSNTPLPETKVEEPRFQQDVRPNNSGNQFDDEKMRAEMKKQVDEAIRQREDAIEQQRNEQQSQPPPQHQAPPPDGRGFPPPPGQRPPPRRP